MKDSRVTRGYGLLEGYLARRRALTANRLILDKYRQGRILDIGSGSHPFFLINADFFEKHGIDKISSMNDKKVDNIEISQHDIESNQHLPFKSGFFDVVTMLAVIEHIEREKLSVLLVDIKRILKPGGAFILTTPSAWTDRLLKLMAFAKLVSRDELQEHKETYNHEKIISHLKEAGFNSDKIKYGFFEIFMNQWVVATKDDKS